MVREHGEGLRRGWTGAGLEEWGGRKRIKRGVSIGRRMISRNV